VFRKKGDLRNDALRSVKVTDVPTTKSGHITIDTDSACDGAAEIIEKSGGKKRRCFYDDSDAEGVRALYDVRDDGGNLRSYTTVREAFCKMDKNVFKNVGGGVMCSTFDDSKALAKQYCGTGDRIASDAACTLENLGTTAHKQLVETYCSSDAGKSDEWCGCIHAKKGRCDLSNASEYAGCDVVNAAHEDLIADIPQESLSGGVRRQLQERKHCRAKICDDPNRHVPDGAMDNCALNLQVCIQDVDVKGHLVDSGIDITCNNEQNNGTDVNNGKGGVNKNGGSGGGVDKNQMVIIGAVLCCVMMSSLSIAFVA
jgi:hypothetical protein